MTKVVVLTSVLIQDTIVNVFYSRGQALSTVLGSEGLTTAICYSLVEVLMV